MYAFKYTNIKHPSIRKPDQHSLEIVKVDTESYSNANKNLEMSRRMQSGNQLSTTARPPERCLALSLLPNQIIQWWGRRLPLTADWGLEYKHMRWQWVMSPLRAVFRATLQRGHQGRMYALCMQVGCECRCREEETSGQNDTSAPKLVVSVFERHAFFCATCSIQVRIRRR